MAALHKLYPERGHVQEVEAVSQHADGQNPLPEHRVGQNKVHDGVDNHRRDDRDRYTEQCATAKEKPKLSGSPNTVWPFESASDVWRASTGE